MSEAAFIFGVCCSVWALIVMLTAVLFSVLHMRGNLIGDEPPEDREHF